MKKKVNRAEKIIIYGSLAILGVWTMGIGLSLAWGIFTVRENTRKVVVSVADAYLNKDLAFRLWGTSHGGVYVPVSEKLQPNPYLAHVPERDIETPSGRKLTLMNPAYMIRDMMEQFSKLTGTSGHLTSLNLLNPVNTPDEWERSVLESFEEGVAEAVVFNEYKGEPHLRLMRPFVTKEPCLKCHAIQGYKVGDVRGGTSISIPMAPYKNIERETMRAVVSLHLVLFVFGVLGIFFGFRKIRNNIRRHLAMEEEKYMLQKQLQQSQKLESIGTIAGGIAHDFNNILSGVLGYAELAKMSLSREDKTWNYVDEIYKAGERASDLVGQILSFTRKTSRDMKPQPVHAVVREAVGLLKISLPKNIRVDLDIDENCGPALLEPTQVHQIVMNLCTNAFHAMEAKGGGVMEVSLHSVNFEAERDLGGRKLGPGAYILLKVSDTGEGIDQENMKNIFEPFYTTKEIGHGTGIGLSLVQGIVQAAGGMIQVESTLGEGTTFSIYFPERQGGLSRS